MATVLCGNCDKAHQNTPDVCIAHALLMVRFGPKGKEERVNKILAVLDPGAFWDAVGPIIDRLVDGGFELTEEAK